MPTSYRELMARLPADRRRGIEAGVTELAEAVLALRDIREARDITQNELANRMQVAQESVSRLERRSDLRLSTLASYVSALGGNLRLTAEFDDSPPIEIQIPPQDKTVDDMAS